MDDLISKKELLLRYGISYGALYRWKRMGLIPEEWFIKKSAVTGQETYFDRATICERIDIIMERKDSCSLEDIAAQLNGTTEKERPSDTLEIVHRDDKITVLSFEEIRSLTRVRANGERIDLTNDTKKEN